MKDVFIVSDNIVSPLGITSAENFSQVSKMVSGIQMHENAVFSEQPFYASLFDTTQNLLHDHGTEDDTLYERLLITSIADALKNSGVEPGDKKTILIISSTKGNISLLESAAMSPGLKKRMTLQHSAKLVADFFQFANPPIVVSNACISGLLAIITAMRMIRNGQYEHAVVAGADVITKFVLSGFQSFQAISTDRCKPFDAARNGINLGEGAGTVILSSNKNYSDGVKVSGGSVTNDANHISGPSRTGEELGKAIQNTMEDAGLTASDVGFISAHGTATIYNDEMEAKAITLAGLQSVPVNSLKGYYGHTLGAAGLIESIISIHSLKQNVVLPTLGFREMGVSKPLSLSNKLQNLLLNNCIKTASGFGGCNAAIAISKQ
ncbi:MAG: beta-ketoacyl synthase N-terminal-like domain-containing protein [Chitinophagaceae bacterium]